MGQLGYTSKAWLPPEIRESAGIPELLAFLNRFPTADPRDVVGLWHHTSVVEQDGSVFVLDGDQIAFIADTLGEAHAYLVGRASATTFVAQMYSTGERGS
ncbi:MAG TPA: hypothetical protein VFW96_24500 [Thermomicrobiales bacterium]|nr:hypothetical protein [Thermomicrobiales bacterium]